MTRFPSPRLCLARQPEVQHLHGAVLADLDVRGLQIPMDDTGLVGRFEGFGDLLGDG